MRQIKYEMKCAKNCGSKCSRITLAKTGDGRDGEAVYDVQATPTINTLMMMIMHRIDISHKLTSKLDTSCFVHWLCFLLVLLLRLIYHDSHFVGYYLLVIDLMV